MVLCVSKVHSLASLVLIEGPSLRADHAVVDVVSQVTQSLLLVQIHE